MLQTIRRFSARLDRIRAYARDSEPIHPNGTPLGNHSDSSSGYIDTTKAHIQARAVLKQPALVIRDPARISPGRVAHGQDLHNGAYTGTPR